MPEKVRVKVCLYLLHLGGLYFERVAILHGLDVACQHIVRQKLHYNAAHYKQFLVYLCGRRICSLVCSAGPALAGT